MGYEMTIDEVNEIISLRIYGSATPEEHISARKEAISILYEKNYFKLLVDLNDLKTNNIVSLTGCYNFGSTFSKFGLPKRSRIANVIPEQGQSKNDILFVTTVAANRGVLIKNFKDLQEAKKWLLS